MVPTIPVASFLSCLSVRFRPRSMPGTRAETIRAFSAFLTRVLLDLFIVGG